MAFHYSLFLSREGRSSSPADPLFMRQCDAAEKRKPLGLDMPRILLKERGAFENADTGGAWLSSARAVRLPVISRRRVRMTSSHHAPYALGDTRATMDRTKDRDPARPKSLVIVGRHTAVNSFPGLVHTARHTMGAGHAPEFFSFDLVMLRISFSKVKKRDLTL
ncbi:hypothetical protein Fmac_018793 [Flemingia macrophylla]|uniref:Uncharacterized protein n=1 Tax=Flemingia macrophylla TaxID=520843 RepID=A0ABD1M5Z7_9FABA